MWNKRTALALSALIFASSIALMGVIHVFAKRNRCPSDCRLVPRDSGTPCKRRQCYCADVDPPCQPRKKTLSTVQRRVIRLLYSFTLIGLGMIIFTSCLICARSDGPTRNVLPREGFPSYDTHANFPERGFKAYDYDKVAEMTTV